MFETCHMTLMETGNFQTGSAVVLRLPTYPHFPKHIRPYSFYELAERSNIVLPNGYPVGPEITWPATRGMSLPKMSECCICGSKCQ